MDKLNKKEVELIKMVYSVYAGTDKMDAFDAANAVRCMGVNPTIALVLKLGGTETQGEKFLTFDEFVALYINVKADKDMGVYEDFIECLKLYDKAENGYMQLSELTHMITGLGEKLSNDEWDECCEDCMDEENDDGEIPYVPFLARMCEKPVPKNIKPE